MAVENVKEEGKRMTVDEEHGRISAVRVWTVLFDEDDDPVARPLLARKAEGIPTPYASHPYHKWLYVRNKRVDTIGPFLYEVTVQYGAETDVGSTGENEPINPLAQWPDVSYFFASSNEPIDRDINGDPLVNSANESFDPPITKDVDDLVIRIVKNQENYYPLLAAEYKGAVNTDVFLGFPAGYVLCKQFEGTRIITATLIYFQVIYEFQVRWDGWKLKIVDEGFREYMGTDAEGKPDYDPIVDKQGIPLSQPTLLNGSGKKLNDGAAIVLREFDVRRKLPFAVLGL